jgi:Protein of unknown function DUF262/Protein of unknown function (DUF1524)
VQSAWRAGFTSRKAQTIGGGKYDVFIAWGKGSMHRFVDDPKPRAPLMFTAQIVQVVDLFANPFLIEVPSYQRSFAWTPKEAGKLLDDINLALDEAGTGAAGDYFLGTMLFIDRDGQATAPSRLWRARPIRALEVIDGIQRLTTLTILLCALRDLAGPAANVRLAEAIDIPAGSNAGPRLKLRDAEDKFFLQYVRAPGATSVPVPAEETLAPSQERVIEVRDHILSELAALDDAERRRLADFLLDRCCAVLVATTGLDRAHRMFTVLNTTGKDLARNDILKAFLLGSVPASDAGRCQEVWTEAEARLGEEFESLFSHIRAVHGRIGGAVISGILELAGRMGAQRFIELVLDPASRTMSDIENARHQGSAHSTAICQHLGYLGWHSFADWKPAALAWWMKHGEDSGALLRFLAKLDRLTFGIRILGIGSSKRAARYGKVIDDIQAGRDMFGRDSPLQLSQKDLRTIQHNLRDLHGRNPPTAKHLLLRLTDMKAGESQSASLARGMTVEHVLPQKLSARSQWREWHPDPEDRERCVASLGNLVLVTKDQNDKAGNADFARKLQVYFNTRGAPAVAVNENLRGQTEWKKAQIVAREAELYQLIEELWQFGMAGPRAQAAE